MGCGRERREVESRLCRFRLPPVPGEKSLLDREPQEGWESPFPTPDVSHTEGGPTWPCAMSKRSSVA